KVDRAFRSSRHMVKPAEWCETHRHVLVFAEDGLVLNYRNPKAGLEHMMAELFVYIGSFFGQLELSRFSSRAIDAHSVLRYPQRCGSGVPPFGYKSVDAPDGKGRILVIDLEQRAILWEMANKLVDEKCSLLRIGQWLNEQGHQTNRAKANHANGGKKKHRWGSASVRDVLR